MVDKPVRIPDICVVTRTYQGQEGRRVKAGTRFAVGKAKEGLQTITPARYSALAQGRLVRPLGEEDAKALPPRAGYGPRPPLSLSGEQKPQSAADVRQAARNRARQPENPPAPKPIARPGSQTGEEKSASSSAEAPASNSSTSPSSSGRGRRGSSASSPSTIPAR